MRVIADRAARASLIIEPDVLRATPAASSSRPTTPSSYRERGIAGPFVQDNHSRSVAGTLRGLHLQLATPQGKLVRVIEGEVFDVAVDIRRGSPTFGRWVGVTLSAENFRQCLHPARLRARLLRAQRRSPRSSTSAPTLYDPRSEIGIAWNDPALGIAWPVAAPLLSARDARLPTLAGVMHHPAALDGRPDPDVR